MCYYRKKILAANEDLASNVASTSRSTESMCRPGGRHYVAAWPRCAFAIN